jgi:hypothetical protein
MDAVGAIPFSHLEYPEIVHSVLKHKFCIFSHVGTNCCKILLLDGEIWTAHGGVNPCILFVRRGGV